MASENTYEEEWICGTDNNVYHRRLVGPEVFQDTIHFLADGCSELCIGVDFTSSLPQEDLVRGLIEGLVQLRYDAPLIAASISGELGNRTWHYTCARDAAEAWRWAHASLILHPASSSRIDGVRELSLTRALYHPADLDTAFACHLYPRALDGNYTILLHGSHAILDARLALTALGILFARVVSTAAKQPDKYLPWGGEHRNLPVDVITASGGHSPQHVPAVEALRERMRQAITSEIPALGLHPQRSTVQKPGLVLRVERFIPAARFTTLTKALKRGGFTVSQILDAAIALATLESNTRDGATVDENAHVTFDCTIVALQRYFNPPYNSQTRLASALAILPLVLPATKILAHGLVPTLLSIRAQYASWLAEPCLPYASAWLPPLAMPNPYAPIVTNVGVVERMLDRQWPAAPVPPVIQVERFTLGNRLVGCHRPTMHAWTIGGEFHLQCAMTDIWDTEYIGSYLDRSLEIMLSLC